ncbi:fumarylacetoacetate hydrolase family protein [Alkalicoccus chagannorensis]
MLFAKPPASLMNAEREKTIDLPGNRGAVHVETELVVRLKQSWAASDSLADAIDGVAVGIDWTLREVQQRLKEAGHPWLKAKGFKGGALLGPMHPFSETAWQQTSFGLRRNGRLQQAGSPEQMVFPLARLLDEVEDWFGTSAGDLLYTGTPAGVGPVEDGDQVELLFQEQVDCRFTVRKRT